MDWVLRSPQIHSTFGNLGFGHADGYHINENCNEALESILHNILTEDKYLRSYRRSIRFGQNVKKDLIPLLIHANEDKTIELLIRILVNLTIPIECLLSVDVISKTDFGRHSIFEINNLLSATKVAFTDHRATKAVIDFVKKNVDVEQQTKLSPEQCTNISNSLLLLRNILHIPEDNNVSSPSPNHNVSAHLVQNQILWNIFSQSIDKILIRLMTIPEATNWAVTMVQLIALLYKDQHVVTLHKLLNMWLEASLSESSEDNESNTSPPDRGSEDSSVILTSDPTSDCSDTGVSGKSNDEPAAGADADAWNKDAHVSAAPAAAASDSAPTQMQAEQTNQNQNQSDNQDTMSCDYSVDKSEGGDGSKSGDMIEKKKVVIAENSDCGYGTQIENQESISTSSNEDELPSKKPVHQKPQHPKQRANNKPRSNGVNLQERKRKKIVKRGKATIINVQGLSHKTPTDDDISNVLKEFTVDFLLKGYNSLVNTLHSQILSNLHLEIDTSHFFWLVTYFLKFATQIELDLENLHSVLSFDILSYLTAEGVNLCEQFELAIKLDGNDLKPSLRRLHLVVTAIREFVQAVEVYKKFSNSSEENEDALCKLQLQMCETEELRSLLVLLLRHYNPKYHTKQYLQDLIVTNHILLLFVDNVMKSNEYDNSTYMIEHIRQFANPEIMYQYGLLLEDYTSNGEFVNDCIFTIMHHVGGSLESLISLFQPKILKTFTSIWKSEFEICDDWSDLIEYVINTFIKKPQTIETKASFCLVEESFEPSEPASGAPPAAAAAVPEPEPEPEPKPTDRWSNDELSSLSWHYMQSQASRDVIGEIMKMYRDDGISKTRGSIIIELFKQNIISKKESENFLKQENEKTTKSSQASKDIREDEMAKLCELLIQDGKSKYLDWVQKVLLDTCLAKIYLENKSTTERNILNLDKKKSKGVTVVSPVSYHSLLLNQSVPLVPWNCAQAAMCKDLKFLQLLHKLGFHMPVDSGKVFIRIPHFWTAEMLYEVAGKICNILGQIKINLSMNDLSDSSPANQQINISLLAELKKDVNFIASPENFYQIQKQNHLATMVNFTPTPGSSFVPENGEINAEATTNWLDLVHKAQENDSFQNVESVCETASVNSDLTRMYVSDEDDKTDILLPPRTLDVNTILEELKYTNSDENASKRPRVYFPPV